MSKNVKMNRKRLIKLTAGEFGLQTREITDAVMGMVNVHKRQHEKSQSEAHKGTKKGGCKECSFCLLAAWLLAPSLASSHWDLFPPGIARSAAHITTARWKPCGGGKTGGSK